MLTVESVAKDTLKRDPTIINYLKECYNSQDFFKVREVLIEYPRWIRNTYNLWYVPLNGEHPDDFSNKIVKYLLQHKG